jgi:Cu/Ag efflux protein CusF
VNRFLAVLIAIVTIAAAAPSANAQVPTSVGKTAIVTVTAVITAIDSTSRLITLKRDDGVSEIVYAGPEVQRFSELKVGDKVTFKFEESVVYAIQQPGAKPPDAEKAGIVRSAGPKPGGKAMRELTVVVTVQAIDMKAPSITVKTEKGETMSFKVEDKSNLTGVKAGDKVQITYSIAVAINVETPKK